MNNTQDLLMLAGAMNPKCKVSTRCNILGANLVIVTNPSTSHYFFDPSIKELMDWLLTLGYFDIIDTRNDIDTNHPTITYCIHDTDIGEGCFYSGVNDLTTEMLNIAIQVAKHIKGKNK